MAVSNILDPIHSGLDPATWENPEDDHPRLKRQHLHWIKDAIADALKKHGYEDPDTWMSLYLTGSLTTYQYSDESDVDVSIFVNTSAFPEWSRSEMIGVMIEEFDGEVKLPGTPHPMQVYVVQADLTPHDLYQPGLRSAYSLDEDNWFVPPERHRAHDVQTEFKRAYAEALEDADKMESLLQYEPHKAVLFYKQVHRRRMHDQQRGKGDYSDSNIIYKFLDKRGLIQQVAQVGGFKVASPVPRIVRKFVFHPEHGLQHTEFGPEEGHVLSHYQLARPLGIEDPYKHPETALGTLNQRGWVTFEGGGGGPKIRYQAQQALKDKFPHEIEGFLGGEMSDPTQLSYEPPVWQF